MPILSSLAIYYSEIWYFPICGFLLQLVISLANPENNRRSDIFPIIGWVYLSCPSLAFSSIKPSLRSFNINPDSDWVSFTSYHCVSTFQILFMYISTDIKNKTWFQDLGDRNRSWTCKYKKRIIQNSSKWICIIEKN